MPAANPINSEVLINSLTFNGTFLGVVEGYEWESSVAEVVVRGEGVMGPTIRLPYARDLIVVVNFLVRPSIPVDETIGALIITTQDGAGAVAHPLGSFKARGSSQQFNRDNPPAHWRQTFAFVGSVVTDPIS